MLVVLIYLIDFVFADISPLLLLGTRTYSGNSFSPDLMFFVDCVDFVYQIFANCANKNATYLIDVSRCSI